MGDRLRPLLAQLPGVTEKKMFGGIGFMLDGNMVVGTTAKGALMVRVSPAGQAAAFARPGAFEMKMGEKTMSGFIGVDEEGTDDPDDLAAWTALALDYVRTLPPK
jgi:TfoX/Sxy family transcriptional regulator of competence genes